MKKIFFALAAAAALFSAVSCHHEDNPTNDDNVFDHYEFRSGLSYSKDVTENFDFSYEIVSNGKLAASGTMPGEELKPVEVKSGLEDGTFEIHFSFKAKDGFADRWDVMKDYVINIDTFLVLYAVNKDGSEEELMRYEFRFSDATFCGGKERAPEIIALMEGVLAISESFTVTRDSSGHFTVIY